jgi:hypothetical protein
MKFHGPTFTLGKNIIQALPYFIASVKSNITGKNANSDVIKRENISASIELLKEIA